MFAIKTEQFGESYLISLIDKETHSSIEILPEYGGAIHQITIRYAQNLYPILWASKDEQDYLQNGLPIYKGSILFPFSDRIENGQYDFEGKSYQLALNDDPHALHGFLNNKKFEVESQQSNDTGALLKLRYNYDGSNEGYPFPFELINTYILKEGVFEFETEIHNKGKSNMPFALGWHPYFIIEDIENVEIAVPAEEEYVLDSTYINSGKTIPFNKINFFKPVIKEQLSMKCFKWLTSKPALQLKQSQLPFIISVESPVNDGYNYFQVYLNKDNKGIGLEPLTGVGNCFNNQEGLEVLGINSFKKYKFYVKVIS